MVAPGTEFHHVMFRDAEAAGRNLRRIAELASSAVIEALEPVLAGVPDPDLALNLFVRLMETHPETDRSLAAHPVLTYYTATIFGHSHWLGETLVQRPELLQSMLRDNSVGRTLAREEYAERLARLQARSGEGETAALLASFKRRELVRILLRDVLGIATIGEITAEISAVADVMIGEALRRCDQWLRNRYSAPQSLDTEGRLVDVPFAVLALGKHGGSELNYSSDIDLLYLFGDGEEPAGAQITKREYFIRLAQELTATLSRTTAEGAPFRIDLRLRPQGNEGEPAVALGHALEYYARRAADWELQALIKVRYAAGDQKLAREFIRRVQPLVYTEKLNFAAVETAVLSREKMQSHRKRSLVVRESGTVDVKLDRGGIRDIEFVVQCLQRVYGGREGWLRSGGTLFSLQKLHDKGHITGRDFHELTGAYAFLRTVEHRLQVRLGQQVHKVPGDRDRLMVLARSVSAYLPEPSPELLLGRLREQMGSVRQIYERIIHQEQVAERAEHDEVFRLRSSVPPGREASQQEILQRLASDAPGIYRLLRQELAPNAQSNAFRVLSAAFTSAERYKALLESREYFPAALEVMTASDLLTDMLARHPEEITSLADIHRGANGGGDYLVEVGNDARDKSPFCEFLRKMNASAEEKLALLRRQYRSRIFASGARDILHRREVFDSLAENTAVALESIEAALGLSSWPGGLAVFALGRLGTCEFDVLSDADLVFVRDESLDSVSATAAATRLMQSVSAYTRDGSLFPVDARLRPHGTAGELVVTPAELLRYFENDAQAWEALTWTKLRYVSGPAELRDEVFAAAGVLFRRYAESSEFLPSLRSVRERLEKSEDAESLRTGPGGLYDLDFIAGSLLVKRGEARFGGNLPQRFAVLQQTGALSCDEARRLSDGARLLRAVEHAVRLATGVARRTLPESGHARGSVEALVHTMIDNVDDRLECALTSSRSGIRALYERLFG